MRPGRDWRPDSIPLLLRRCHGTPPDELAHTLRELGDLVVVEDGRGLVDLANRLYLRYLEARALVVDPWWWSVLDAVRQLRALERPWTAEDLGELVGRPPHPNALGGALRALCRRGAIRPVGVVNARGRLMRTWAATPEVTRAR